MATRSDLDRPLLATIRIAALECRASARLDLFRACAMLGPDREAAAGMSLDALLRTLGQALGRTPRFYRPGTANLSFDERWLLSLLTALRRQDAHSATFLIHSRVPHHARRSVAFLAGRVAVGRDDLTSQPQHNDVA